VSLAGLALMVLGLGFLIAEAFVTSYGLLALGGLASFVVGSLILFGGSGAGPRLSLAVVLPVAAVLGATTLLLLTKALRAQKAPGRSGVEALVGAEGEVVAPLEPTGFVAIRGEYWQAVSNVALPRGTRVRVVGAEARRLTVEAAQPRENEEVKP
jgi:membrane-bound serine protease (ClpP class)